MTPIEGDVAKAVMKHFPAFQRDYSALATKLENLKPSGRGTRRDRSGQHN